MVKKYIIVAFVAAVLFLSGCVTPTSSESLKGYCGLAPQYCGPGPG
jgi:hypothetical protein